MIEKTLVEIKRILEDRHLSDTTKELRIIIALEDLYNDGYQNGDEDGWGRGYDEGKSIGYRNGWDAGYDVGIDSYE